MTAALPLPPDLRPIGARELALLAAGLAIVIVPHALRAPLWLTLLTTALIGWRALGQSAPRLLPPVSLLLMVVAAGML
ncbi:MAG TPA: hypothetical protein VI229_06900, partial [Burkholderiales bacterium]